MRFRRLACLAFLSGTIPQSTIAQNYSGTYTASDQTGAAVTLVLQQDAQLVVTGTFSIAGLTFRVQGNIEDGDLYAAAGGDAGALYLEGSAEDGELYLLLAEVGPGNQPDFDNASELLLQRQGVAGAARAPAAPVPATPATTSVPPSGSGGTAAPADRQLTQLLLSSKWCSFSYSGVSGTGSGSSRTESILFNQDGTAYVESGGESYYGGPEGSAAGQRGASGQFNWRVTGGKLLMSTDGGSSWQTVDLEVSYNSNGYPILNADETEYAQCS